RPPPTSTLLPYTTLFRSVLEVPDRGLGDLAQIVRRDVGRHADGDAGGAVDEQVREARREHRGLLRAAVVVVLEVDGVLVDVAHRSEEQRLNSSHVKISYA